MNRLFLLATALLLTGPAHAQLGLKAGATLLSLTSGNDRYWTTSNALRSRIGYQVGLYYQLPLTERLALVPEVQFSRENAYAVTTIQLLDGQSRGSYDIHLSYLNVPVLLRAGWGPVYAEAGAQASLLVGGRLVGSETTAGGIIGQPFTTYVDQAATATFRRFDAGPCVGAGIKLPAGLVLGLRAYWGLRSLYDDTQPYPVNSIALDHRHVLQASLAYQLLGRQ